MERRLQRERQEQLRQLVVACAKIYSSELSGKVFLYVCGEEYIEVAYQTKQFKHLTGVTSDLLAVPFYRKAKAEKITPEQVKCYSDSNFSTAKQKLSALSSLPEITRSRVFLLKDLKTRTVTYTLGLTNLKLTIGLTENRDCEGNLINSWYLPRTLRVRDSSIERSADAKPVDFIFRRDAADPLYDTVTYRAENTLPPDSVKPLLSEETVSGFREAEFAGMK